MKSRFIIVLLSILFAAVATFGVAYYMAKLEESFIEGQELAEILVAKRNVASGTPVSELTATGAIALAKVPKRYVAEGALKSTSGYEDMLLSSNLVKGDQITASKFKKVDKADLNYKVPEGFLAVSIPVDDVIGVGGRLSPGDKVDIFATFQPGPSGRDITKVMLQNVEIVATTGFSSDSKSGNVMGGQQSGTGKKTVTLALSALDVEKLIFAAEEGHIWLGLRHAGDEKLIISSGQTVETVFR